MSSLADPPSRRVFSEAADGSGKTRNLTVLSSSTIASPRQSPGARMDATPPASGPAGTATPTPSSSAGNRAGAISSTNGSIESGHSNNNAQNQVVGAAAAAQQPKVVQTAFIHKLYKYVYLPHQAAFLLVSIC